MNTTLTKPKQLKNKNIYLLLFFILLLFSSAFSCKEDPPIVPPPPPPPVLKDTLTISVTDVTHRSTSLNVQCTMNNLQSLVRLYRLFNSNETLVAEFPIIIQDTTIIDDNNGTGLQLNTNYFYYAVRIDTTGDRKDTSNIVEAATLDTTSHNYIWQEFVIGDAGFSNALYDVWGTDENNVWACGGVRINDTTYGVLKWNGVEWLPEKRIGGLQAIFGFSENDIWVVGNGIWYYNGNSWIDYGNIIRNPGFYDNGPYTSIWGTSSSNLYLGNEWGKIIHWDGSQASVVYIHPNSIPITDIYGINENFVLACGSSLSTPSVALKFDGLNWNSFVGLNLSGILFRTVFGWNSKDYFIGGSSNFRYLNNILSEILQQAPGIIERIRSDKATGEIVAVGDGFTLLHFNGVDWRDYSYELNQPNSAFYGVYLTNGKIFAIGAAGTIGKIFIGTQY